MVDAAGSLDNMRSTSVASSRLEEIWPPLRHIRLEIWTTTGGIEIVAELLAIFFAEENPFPLGFIDRDCFLEDMRNGDGRSTKYCSKLLVNAICAISSVSTSFCSIQSHECCHMMAVMILKTKATDKGNSSLHML